MPHADSVIDLFINAEMLTAMLAESAVDADSMRAALLV